MSQPPFSDKYKWKEVRVFLNEQGYKSDEFLDLFKEFGTRIYGKNATAHSCKRTYAKFNKFKEWIIERKRTANP